MIASQPTETARHRVLIVEDDPDMCMFLSSAASGMDTSMDIQFASSVHEATLWLNDDDQQFDLVLADFMLADSRNGYELQNICRDRSPEIRFAMMSSMPLAMPAIEESSFLQKPFSPTQVQEFLEARLS